MESPVAPPPPPAYPPPVVVERPGIVTAGGIVMIVVGVLIILFGLLLFVGGAFVGGAGSDFAETQGFGTMVGAFTGMLFAFAAILLALGILDIVAGAQVLSGKGWARITGIVLAALFVLLGLSSLFSGDTGSLIFGIVWLAANAFIIYALIVGGRWFAARSAAH